MCQALPWSTQDEATVLISPYRYRTGRNLHSLHLLPSPPHSPNFLLCTHLRMRASLLHHQLSKACSRLYTLHHSMQVAISAPPDPSSGPASKIGMLIGIESGDDDVGAPVPRTAQASAVLESPLQSRRLTAWLPATSRTFAFTDLLPSTLVPQMDTCLQRFTVSPVARQEKDWCSPA